MNTLLGEIAACNDVQFPRYRFALKLCKLQATFLLQELEIAVLRDIFHSTGVQPLPVDYELSESQITSIFAEIFSSISKSLRGQVPQASLQEAHATCLNWFLMAFEVDGVNKATVGRMKVVLLLFCKGKMSEKAKHLFNVLVKNGNLGKDGINYFCETVQILASCLNETVYSGESSVNRATSECLYLLRETDDILEDEKVRGGVQRPWLSCMEFVKVFTANPPVNFLSWLDLWYSLPQMQKVIHSVKCSICETKTITGFRYQCSECTNYHMCQMCFLKGRCLEPHDLEHQVFECRSYSKSLKGLFNKHSQPKDSRVMDEPREPPTIRGGIDIPDGSIIGPLQRLNSIGENSLSRFRSPSMSSESSYKATELRIGSRNSLVTSGSLKRNSDQLQLDSMRRMSLSSTNSSESRSSEEVFNPGVEIGEMGTRKQAPIISSLKKPDPNNPLHRSLRRLSKEYASTPISRTDPSTVAHQFSRQNTSVSLTNDTTCSPSDNHITHSLQLTETKSDGMLLNTTKKRETLAQMNRKMNDEIDELLREFTVDISPVSVPNQNTKKDDKNTMLSELLQEVEKTAQIHKSQEDSQKSKHSTDLDSLLNQFQNDMNSGFTALRQPGRMSLPGHYQLRVGSHDDNTGLDHFHKLSSTSKFTSDARHKRMSVAW